MCPYLRKRFWDSLHNDDPISLVRVLVEWSEKEDIEHTGYFADYIDTWIWKDFKPVHNGVPRHGGSHNHHHNPEKLAGIVWAASCSKTGSVPNTGALNCLSAVLRFFQQGSKPYSQSKVMFAYNGALEMGRDEAAAMIFSNFYVDWKNVSIPLEMVGVDDADWGKWYPKVPSDGWGAWSDAPQAVPTGKRTF